MLRYLLLIVLLALPIIINRPAAAMEPQVKTPETIIEVKKLDPRAKILQAYLAKYNSPLQYHAADFIEAADKYELDWRLVPCIAGVESTFGKKIPGGTDPKYTSYNGWGWGVYGTQAIYFKSWREGIFTVSEGLRKNYFNKGLKDPYTINRVYAASPTWGSKVTWFLNDLSKFEANYKINESKLARIPDVNFSTAGQSAQIRITSTHLLLD